MGYEGSRTMNDIRVFTEETEDKGPNGCGNNNGGCSYICIPTPNNRSKCLPHGTEAGAESASTNTVIITVVCVVAGVVIVAVVVALVVVFKLRRKSDDKEDVAFIRGGTKPDIPLEPRPATSYSAFDVADNIYSKSRLGKSGNSSNDKGESSSQQHVRFTKGKRLPYMANREQATAPSDGYSNLGDEEERVSKDFHSGDETE
ncbi:uncharacterized protein LOC112557729 [Pomacea canaliculata]|uniref:uncharacterized protein LOC112557729 n=1 Tax=Pomacea canaliculata TaxID=400727 RepID=UPI000D726D92|nr:uncharacterized protein LOC112557729 [Pomacea canaliculata]